MSARNDSGLLAIDVGNSNVKLAWYPPQIDCLSETKPASLPIASPRLIEPELTNTLTLEDVTTGAFSAQFQDWLDRLPATDSRCYLASVHDGVANTVTEHLVRSSFGTPHVLSAAELPLRVRVEEPGRVGIDRLLCAVAANCMRERNRPAIVVSLGTACTVNLIATDGAFEGGAILPGITMSAKALHRETSSLPLVAPKLIDAPEDAIGKSTHLAISSGLIWGLVGAIRELMERMSQHSEQPAHLFITGGEAPQLAAHFLGSGSSARHIPNMVLVGIRIAAGEIP